MGKCNLETGTVRNEDNSLEFMIAKEWEVIIAIPETSSNSTRAIIEAVIRALFSFSHLIYISNKDYLSVASRLASLMPGGVKVKVLTFPTTFPSMVQSAFVYSCLAL